MPKQEHGMNKETAIKLFNDQKIRTHWDEEQEKWYFSIVDVVAVLTESVNPQAYWRKLKQRLRAEGNETVTNCHGLKMIAPDGKMRLTDVADTEELFRLIQSIPSPKAEPFKIWLARVGRDRIDEWETRGAKKGQEFAILTDEITKAWSELTTKQYKKIKDLKKENLRDHMTNLELVLNMLAEATTTEISKEKKPKTFNQNKKIAKQGGTIAGNTRKEIEEKTGKKIVTGSNAKELQNPQKGKLKK